MEQLGASFLQLLLAPPTPTDPYPELPVEVDDEYILPDRILEQPPGQLSLMTGFIHAIKIYMTMNPLVSIEISYGLSTLGWPDQKAMLSDCLTAVKSITDELPPELQLETQVNGNQDGSGAAGEAPEEGGSFRYMPPTFPEEQPADDLRNLFASDPARRRQLQYGIQKANIYSSQLATRSFYVERYLTLRDVFRASQVAARFAESSGAADKPVDQKPDVAAAANGKGPDEAAPSADATNGVTADTVAVLDEYIDDGIDTAMVAERELIVQSLLAMVETLPPRMMEPNGGSLVNKVRLVASTLLNDPEERKGPQAVKAEAQLQAFLAHLVRLDKTSAVGGPGGGDEATAASAGPVDDKVGVAAAAGAAGACEGEEAELRLWAGLRDHNQSQQARFPSGNGTFLPA